MQSNDKKRKLSGRVLVIGVLCVLVGLLVIGLTPNTSQKAESGDSLQVNEFVPGGLTVQLHFQKSMIPRTLELTGCSVYEAAGKLIPCVKEKSVGPTWFAQVALEWSGGPESGCATVGGVRYCW